MTTVDAAPIVFVDTETTSLTPFRRVWDFAGILVRSGEEPKTVQIFVDMKDLDLANADPRSLAIGRFHQRHPQMVKKVIDTGPRPGVAVHSERRMLQLVESLTRGAVVVAANAHFDVDVLARRMRANQLVPMWHHHPVDVEALAAGDLGMRPDGKWSLSMFCDEYGIQVDEEVRHTALGDARLVQALYDAVYAEPD